MTGIAPFKTPLVWQTAEKSFTYSDLPRSYIGMNAYLSTQILAQLIPALPLACSTFSQAANLCGKEAFFLNLSGDRWAPVSGVHAIPAGAVCLGSWAAALLELPLMYDLLVSSHTFNHRIPKPWCWLRSI